MEKLVQMSTKELSRLEVMQRLSKKEMRLPGINSREDGNACLQKFMGDFNDRFADEPRSSLDAHRKLTAKDDLARILTWQEARTISKNLTIQFENVVYQIQTERPTYTMRNAAATVSVDAGQNIILFKKASLCPTIFFTNRQNKPR
jgi:hypothetical protein